MDARKYVSNICFGWFCCISVLINVCLQHSLKQRCFKGTPVEETREETQSNNFAVAALLFSLAVRVTPLICFQ